MGRFTGKVTVVTEAGGGIGRAAAARLAAEGASLVLVDRATATLKETQAIVERAGGTALAVEADVTRWDDVRRYVAAATERFGGVDLFFNNAGILGDVSPLVQYDEATFDRVLAVNVISSHAPCWSTALRGSAAATAPSSGWSHSPARATFQRSGRRRRYQGSFFRTLA
jgi:NAD(P)-dependent dehydrogenase (short-subunit alcohol dehydrogenase family)